MILEFSERRPLLFVLIVTVGWMALVSVLAVLLGNLLSKPMIDPLVQTAATMAATLLLLLGACRIGWIKTIGITQAGSPIAWIAVLVLAIYVLAAGFYAYFGEFSFRAGSLLGANAWPILLQGLRVGFVEEVVFRGILLYALLRVWGKTYRGAVAALLVQAGLFALPHAFQALAGVSPTSVLSNLLATFVFGLWCGALVVASGSLWPAIFLHAISNSFILIKGLSSAWITPYHLGYLRGALFELPLVLVGVWVVVKIKDKQAGDMQAGSEVSVINRRHE